MAETRNKKVPLTAYTIPGTRVANRTEIFNDDDQMDTTVEASDSQRMDALMQKLMGTNSDTESEPADEKEQEDSEMEKEQESKQEINNEPPAEEAFAFRLFASKPVAKVNITEKDDDHTNMLAELAAKQQIIDFDQENDPEFIALVQASVVNYDDILVQSKQPYYTERNSKRVIHIPSLEQQQQQEEKEAADKKKQRRKSKKRRDFEKAVREGRIQVKPNMRNPVTEGGWPGWPGWPGRLTKCHIITNISSDDIKKSGKKNGPLPPLPSFSSRGRGGFGRGGFGNRGNRGGVRGRGRGRGGSS